MPRRTIKQVLMSRDRLTEADADARIREAKDALLQAIDDGDLFAMEEICYDHFGLEPDYLDELMEGL